MQSTLHQHARLSLVSGAILAGLSVGLGAFAAHAMKAHYDDAAMRTFEIGVRYQMFHGLALIACGLMQMQGFCTRVASLLFLSGIALFSGSLYGIALLQAQWLGPITPLGGVLFLAGWIALAIASRKQA